MNARPIRCAFLVLYYHLIIKRFQSSIDLCIASPSGLSLRSAAVLWNSGSSFVILWIDSIWIFLCHPLQSRLYYLDLPLSSSPIKTLHNQGPSIVFLRIRLYIIKDLPLSSYESDSISKDLPLSSYESDSISKDLPLSSYESDSISKDLPLSSYESDSIFLSFFLLLSLALFLYNCIYWAADFLQGLHNCIYWAADFLQGLHNCIYWAADFLQGPRLLSDRLSSNGCCCSVRRAWP